MALTSLEGEGRISRRIRTAIIFMGLGFLSATVTAPAQAQNAPVVSPPASPSGININPKRVTFDRAGKSVTVSVSAGGGAGAFAVDLVDRFMKPSGEITALEPGETAPEAARVKSAKGLVVLSPRRIRFTEGGSQIIRLRASAAANLAPGEYRSHLTITGIPPADTGLTAEQAAGLKDNELSFRINSVLAIAIPVILRVGPVDVRAAIENAAVSFETVPDEGGKPVRKAALSFDLVRVGANSLFGNIDVRGSSKRGEPIGAVRGIGVYPEIDRRTVKILLTRIPVAGEQLEISFADDDSKPGTVLSKVSLTAP